MSITVERPAQPEAHPVLPPQRASVGATTRRQAVETLVGTFVFGIVWTVLCNIVLELLHPDVTPVWLVGKTLHSMIIVFLLSSLVLWAVFLLLLALTSRFWLSCGVLLSLVLLLGTVDRLKIRLRQEPVYPDDVHFLGNPQFLMDMVHPWQLALGFLALVAVVVVVVLLGRKPTRTFQPIRRAHLLRWWGAVQVTRVVVLALSVGFLSYAAGFNHDGNKLRLAYEANGAEWAYHYQRLNYQKNTTIGGLLYNLLADPMRQPAGYSEATMAEVAKRWAARAAVLNKGASGSLDDVNVLMVLSEAFSDPLALEPRTVEGDPIPRTRELMRHTTSGSMLAQYLGGGTANVEFEVLTGQSISQFRPQVNTPYQQFVHEMKSYPSIVGHLAGEKHKAIAIHPYFTAMYQRKKVYRAFGITDFVHDTTMQSRAKIDDSDFISDKAAFDEILYQVKRSERPLLANVVTMQNHFPMQHLYHDPWKVHRVKGLVKSNLEGYARGLNHTDQALADLLHQLSSSREKTVVLFYGDHLPALWDDAAWNRNGELKMRSTPYFIWSNFDQRKLEVPPVSSPIFFMPLVYEQVGAPLPPFYALLHDLQQELPAFEHGFRVDGDGKRIAKGTDLGAHARQLLADYRLVTYDLSVGKRYSQDLLFPQR